jgi:hypothetical protein
MYLAFSFAVFLALEIINSRKDYLKDEQITEDAVDKRVISINGFETAEWGIYFVSEALPNFMNWRLVRVENRSTEESFLISLDEIEIGLKCIGDEY